MQPEINPTSIKRVKGWIFDVYPSIAGQMNVWFIAENGKRIRLVDDSKPRFYVSTKHGTLYDLYCLVSRLPVDSCRLVSKYVEPQASLKSTVLEVTLKNYIHVPFFVRRVLRAGRYLRYQIYNCDLKSSQVYLYEREIFPFAFVDVKVEKDRLSYTLLDSVENLDYRIPNLRILKLDLDMHKKHRLGTFNDSIEKLVVSFDHQKVIIDSGTERYKLFQFGHLVRKFDPDIVLTRGGDSFVFPYLAKRATVNNILDDFVLSRDNHPLLEELKKGKSYFSYGKTYYRAPTRRLYGRVHIDENNTFILRESGLEGLIEIARTCRVPLHRAARSSIGTSMSSLQNYQALKDGFIVPRNKQIGETFKSAYQLLIGDRGGFVYEPKIGIHEQVGEIDFSSMYPSLMTKYNISAETVICGCCPDSKLRIPELDYNICEKRLGIVPKVLGFVVKKRLRYKTLVNETKDDLLRELYDKRQSALKWILVTCFGYLGYRNAKFGTIDGHMGVCAVGRNLFLTASHISEDRGFSVIHGIVDSLWLTKKGAVPGDYSKLCAEISKKVDLPLDLSGLYKWIVFLPSKIHPNIPVLNRYYGVKENGSLKIRGLEVRRRDTPKFIYDAQMEMLKVLASAGDSESFVKKIPHSLKVIEKYRRKLLANEVPVWDLIVSKRLSKELEKYIQNVNQKIAAEQLVNDGFEVSAGKTIKFLFTDAHNKRHNKRVRAKELIEDRTNPDLQKYLSILYSAASTVLSPFNYSVKDVQDFVRDSRQIDLDYFKNYL